MAANWKPGILFVIVILAAAFPSLAQQISYESAAVGRVVGETPGEMAQQLAGQDLQLGQASYFGDNNLFSLSDTERANDTISVLKEKFPGKVDAHFVESLILGRWSWDDVKESAGKLGEKLLLVEAHGNVEDSVMNAESPDYFDGSLTPLNLDWNLKGGNLVVFDSDFAGAHLPKASSLVGKLNRDAVVIAPTAVPDKEFVKVFACNLGKYGTIGETYRESRNNYYWQANRPSGIALMSYELYGNPTAPVSVPSYDESSFDEFCKDYMKNFAEAAIASFTVSPSLSLAALAGGDPEQPLQYTRESSFTIESYSVADAGEHSFLLADGTTLSAQEGELMLPAASIVEEFPPKTVVTAVRNASFGDAVDVEVKNLPMWYGEPVRRECFSEKTNASMGYSNSFTGSEEKVAIAILPVEVVSCSEGKLRLYKRVNYSVDYIPYSPVLLKDVSAPAEAFPGQTLNVTVVLKSMLGSAFEGELVLSNGTKNLAEKKVAFADGQTELPVELSFAAPSAEGVAGYRLEFFQDNDSKTFYDFSISVKALKLSLETPVTAGESGEVSLLIENNMPSPIEAIITSYLIKGEEVVTASHDKTLAPGANEVKISYDGLKREDASYGLLATVNYGNAKESASSQLVTNHPPVLEPVADVAATEGEKVVLSPKASDIDGDAVIITYAGNMSGSEWQTKIGDAGEYKTIVTASDGLLESSQAVKITVLVNNDVDGDGFEKDADCNDSDPSVNPGADEQCNDADDDCDGQADDDLFNETKCGFKGVQSLACSAGKWLPVGECENPGECMTGENESRACIAAGIGVCAAGSQLRACSEDFEWGSWEECKSAVAPESESCNGLDDDCDGKADEDFGDADADGIADCVDTDNDNDGIEDSEDDLIGDKSGITVNGESGTAEVKVKELGKGGKNKNVKIISDGKLLLEFTRNFSKGNITIRSIAIEKQKETGDTGFIIVKGLDLRGGQKTAYVDRLIPGSNAVCVKDSDISSISEISSGCDWRDEKAIKCGAHPGKGSSFSCTLAEGAGQYAISGLYHSGVIERCIDGDSDSYLPVGCSGGLDCNDSEIAISPAAAEKCNGVDDNCNGKTDENRVCNTAPELHEIKQLVLNENETFSVALHADDSEADQLTYSSPDLPEGAQLSTTGLFSWTPTFSQAGSYEFTVKASDDLLSDSEKVSAAVNNVNRQPAAAISSEPEGNMMNEGKTKVMSSESEDPDGDKLSHQWLHNGKEAADTLTYRYVANWDDGDSGNPHRFTLTVSDGNLSANATLIISVKDTQECQPQSEENEKCSGNDAGKCDPGTKTRTCSFSYFWSEWSECAGTVRPEPEEDCSTWEDDNCNGRINEGCLGRLLPELPLPPR